VARRGLTLVEMLMVIVIISILLALLLPAILGAIRTARKAAVTSEIAQLAQALANFKAKYGDYPPSRFLAVESGNYSVLMQTGATTALNTTGKYGDLTQVDPESPLGSNDITVGQLAQRSVAYLRKFWPRVSTTGAPAGQFYDFNGNNNNDGTYVVHGHECLVLFLGGIPAPTGVPTATGAIPVTPTTTFGMGGFGKDPTNPFTAPSTNSNRQPALFEFNPGRLMIDPNSASGIPGYYDSLGNPSPTVGGISLNFYAYFNAYGSGAYDPNDVNFAEVDGANSGPIGLTFSTAFPVSVAGNYCESLAPNPYTGTVTVAYNATSNTGGPPTITWQQPQSFQIISAGIDGLYGVAGQYISNPTGVAAELLPIDKTTTTSPYINTTDIGVRNREQDNLTNFKTGALQ
jgi:general secretion pathway protein G